MFALLAGATLLVVIIPMLPALVEWLRPSDVVPLPIDETDALDPPFLAHRFHGMLAQALRSGATHLGNSELAVLPRGAGAAPWPFSVEERDKRASRRLWHVDGDAQLPEQMAFQVEVAATGTLRSAPYGVYRALWSDRTLHVSAGGIVLRWAHGREVLAQEKCVLAGRVTAAECLTLAGPASFTLLHAPTIRFMPSPPRATPRPMAALPIETWPAELAWDPDQRRGFSKGSVSLPPGRAWTGDIVSIGDLALGDGCDVSGSLRTHGRLWLGRDCRVSGSVFADGGIQLDAGCAIAGAVVSETAVDLGEDCRIGAPDKVTTLAAPRIQVAANVTVHGTVWAGEHGGMADVRVLAQPVEAERVEAPGTPAIAETASEEREVEPVAPLRPVRSPVREPEQALA